MKQAIGIIPARFHSTRLEGKPLADINGKPMIQHVYENVIRSSVLDDALVATDDMRIKETVENFGGNAVLTSKDHPTGTDRISEVAENLDVQVVVNIQGDEPFINPAMIDKVVSPLLEDSKLPMCTLMHEIKHKEDFRDPNVAKVVTDRWGFALYFSRSLIPYPWHEQGHPVYENIGIYAFQKEFLLTFSKLKPTALERSESLEQLRALENGFRIKVVLARDYISFSVDTPEDLERARAFAKRLERG